MIDIHTHLLFELTIIIYIYGLHRRRALIDAVCGKLPSTWYTLIGENFDPDEETIVKEANNKKDIEDAFNESKDDFDSLYVVLNDESYVAYSKGSKLIWK